MKEKETKQTYIKNLDAMEKDLKPQKGLITKIEEMKNTDYFGVHKTYNERNGIQVTVKINSPDGEEFTQWFSIVQDVRGLQKSNIWAFKQKYDNYPDVGIEVDVELNENGFDAIVF